MNLRKLLSLVPAVAALAPLSVAAAAPFGRFGGTLNDAKQTHFFTWFHMEQTAEENGTLTFQPSGPRFHDLVKLKVRTASGEIRGMTLTIRRSFIDGRDSAFARDITKSFLESGAHGDSPMTPDLESLLNEIWNSPNGSTVIRADGPRPTLPERPSAAYRVFAGREEAWSGRLGNAKVDMRNDDGWLLIGVTR